MFFSTSILLTAVFCAFLILIVVARTLRRLRPRKLSDIQLQADFSIEELHKLHLAGDLSAEEFERAKESVLKRAPDKPPGGARGFAVVQKPE